MPKLGVLACAVALLCAVAAIGHAQEAVAAFLHAREITCPDRSIAAGEVRTASELKAFVKCAQAYVAAAGEQEAYRAFHNDERRLSDEIYVLVTELIPSSQVATIFVNPAQPLREGAPWGELKDQFGDDIFAEVVRVVVANGEGWAYYSFLNPVTGANVPKASHVTSVI